MRRRETASARGLLVAFAALVALSRPAGSETAPQMPSFALTRAYCPMAHCDGAMSDNLNTEIPAATPTLIADDLAFGGSRRGLGCVSNGPSVACTYAQHVARYSADGTPLRVDYIGDGAWTSAPILSSANEVIAVSRTTLARLAPDGSGWMRDRALPETLPTSPVLTLNGAIVLATASARPDATDGPIVVHRLVDGMQVGVPFRVRDSTGAVYHSVNTPAVRGNRVYVSMNTTDVARGLFVALDVDPANALEPVRLAWSYAFRGPSRASPLRVGDTLYFDGGSEPATGTTRTAEPRLYAIRDHGATRSPAYTLRWSRPWPRPLVASPARDPRGGIWVFGGGSPWLSRISESTGADMQPPLNLDVLLANPTTLHAPSSVMSIGLARAADRMVPAMIVAGKPLDPAVARPVIAAIDLVNARLLWTIPLALAPDDYVASQFAVAVNPQGKPRVVFPTTLSGARFYGEP